MIYIRLGHYRYIVLFRKKLKPIFVHVYQYIYLPSLRSVRWRPSLGLDPGESVSLSTLPPLCDSGAKNRKTGRQVIAIEQRDIRPRLSNNFIETVKITTGLGLSRDIGSEVNFVARNSCFRFKKKPTFCRIQYEKQFKS